MASDIEGLAVREGYFLLESGLHAATWIDLHTTFLEPKTLAPQIAALAALSGFDRIPTTGCSRLFTGYQNPNASVRRQSASLLLTTS